jgi:putative oligomerization/nucleic acid binding protein
MALLSQLMRTAAITGDPNRVNAWFADRQGKRWAEQTVRAAFPEPRAATRPTADPAERLRTLRELHERGVLTDAELERLRTRIDV